MHRMKYAAVRSKCPFYCGGLGGTPGVERQETDSGGVTELTVGLHRS